MTASKQPLAAAREKHHRQIKEAFTDKPEPVVKRRQCRKGGIVGGTALSGSDAKKTAMPLVAEVPVPRVSDSEANAKTSAASARPVEQRKRKRQVDVSIWQGNSTNHQPSDVFPLICDSSHAYTLLLRIPA